MSKKVDIILLNGVGSVGKTSIAKELQKILDKPYLYMDIDHFVDMLPPQYKVWGQKTHDAVSFYTKETKDGPITSIHIGPVGKKYFNSMRKAMVGFTEDDFSLIISDVIMDDSFEKYKKIFKDYNLITIGVFASLDVIEKREKQRGDRALGLARWQYDIVHKDKKYDFKVDTSKLASEECALQIKQYLYQ